MGRPESDIGKLGPDTDKQDPETGKPDPDTDEPEPEVTGSGFGSPESTDIRVRGGRVHATRGRL